MGAQYRCELFSVSLGVLQPSLLFSHIAFRIFVRLQHFVSERKRSQYEEDELKRVALAQKRSLLIQKGRITPELEVVLTSIFSSYAETDIDEDGEILLDTVTASRLWYRCGMKLSGLESILEKNARSSLTMADFMEVITRIVQEDENATGMLCNRSTPGTLDFGSQAMLNLYTDTRASLQSESMCKVRTTFVINGCACRSLSDCVNSLLGYVTGWRHG